MGQSRLKLLCGKLIRRGTPTGISPNPGEQFHAVRFAARAWTPPPGTSRRRSSSLPGRFNDHQAVEPGIVLVQGDGGLGEAFAGEGRDGDALARSDFEQDRASGV